MHMREHTQKDPSQDLNQTFIHSAVQLTYSKKKSCFTKPEHLQDSLNSKTVMIKKSNTTV